MIASIDGVKLRRPVVPGDQLRLEVQSQRIKNSSACVKGEARVGESLAAEAQFRFVILDADRVAGSLEWRFQLATGRPCGRMSAIAGRIGQSS